MFSPQNVITSDLKLLEGQNVNFDLQHSLAFPAEKGFLEEYCLDNFLVLEVWNQVCKNDDEVCDNLIGLATISLTALYDAFSVSFFSPCSRSN